VAAIKLDENVPDSFGQTLSQSGHDVALARDEELAGAADERLLAVATSENRVLISLDRHFTNILQHAPETSAGIAVVRLHRQTLPAMRRAAMALGNLLSREIANGRLFVLDESRLRIWPRP